MRWLGILLLTACRFGFDPQDPAPILPAHIAEAPDPIGPLAFDTDALIDTTALTIDDQLPPETVVFTAVRQVGGGPDLALLVVTDFAVGDAVVRVVGDRPLVVVAGTIAIGGLLDGSARLSQPGPGGSPPGMGDGAGEVATNTAPGDVCDAAGGGAGFGKAGAAGGKESCTDEFGDGGLQHGDLDLAILIGGSGGGSGSPGNCPVAPGGAGGGAIQLTASSIAIDGEIRVGGGGGTGGPECADVDAGAGAGGGAGGAIYLEGRSIVLGSSAILAVGGGGGGAGGNGSIDNGPVGDGMPGGNGTAIGGAGGDFNNVVTAGNGGTGGTPDQEAGAGEPAEFNPGGGGGGAGRIVQRRRTD